VLSKLSTVDGPGSGLNADVLGGIDSDGFLQGRGSESSSSIGMVGGNSLSAEAIPSVGKLTVTCSNPAQPKTAYTNDSSGDQRVFVDAGSGAAVSEVLPTTASTAETTAGTSLNDARHTTYFARLGSGYLMYDVWMTTAGAGSPGACNYFVIRRVLGFPF
jgi:hypothetical protein